MQGKRRVLVWLLLICLVATILVPVVSVVALAEPAVEKAKIVKVKRIALNTDEESLETKERVKLVATVFPANATNKKVAWSSSKKAVATVSATGLVTAKKPGETVITCKAKDGSGKKAICHITVEAVEVEDISLNTLSITLAAGKRQVLKATVKPANATNKKLIWSTDDPSVASVAGNGMVTAKSAGEATITCAATDGSGVEAICAVTVVAAGSTPTPAPTPTPTPPPAVFKNPPSFSKVTGCRYTNAYADTISDPKWIREEYFNVTNSQVGDFIAALIKQDYEMTSNDVIGSTISMMFQSKEFYRGKDGKYRYGYVGVNQDFYFSLVQVTYYNVSYLGELL